MVVESRLAHPLQLLCGQAKARTCICGLLLMLVVYQSFLPYYSFQFVSFFILPSLRSKLLRVYIELLNVLCKFERKTKGNVIFNTCLQN